MAERVSIPVVDIYAQGADRNAIARTLVDAAADCGFVYIKNTGHVIAPQKIQQAFDTVSLSVACCWSQKMDPSPWKKDQSPRASCASTRGLAYDCAAPPQSVESQS